jgi:hypothetical protein
MWVTKSISILIWNQPEPAKNQSERNIHHYEYITCKAEQRLNNSKKIQLLTNNIPISVAEICPKPHKAALYMYIIKCLYVCIYACILI